MSSPNDEERQSSTQASTISSFEKDKKTAKLPVSWPWRIFSFTRRKLLVMVAAMVLGILPLVLGLGLGLGLHHKHAACPPGPLIDLEYARYRGRSYGGVNEWLGLRYAAAPTGELRFAAPQPPISQEHTQSACQHGAKCLPVRASQSNNPSSNGYSEDCLFLDVYAPSNATANTSLPVYVFIQGGGFIENSGNYNGSTLVKASDMQIVVVMIGYRVGPYGFLASDEVRGGGSLNNGLKDQRMALHWIQDHISKFGGDPGHVVFGGASAGAASVTLQLAAYGGRNEDLFHATLAESQSFAALRTVEESQYQYDELVQRTKCDDSSDTLKCLRSLSIKTLQGQNYGMQFPGTTRNPLFAYNPTLDFDFISDYTLNLFSSGQYVKLPAIYGHASNEGTVFAPKYTNTTTDFNNWMQAQFPALNATQKAWFSRTYPPEKQYPRSGEYWQSLARAYGELRYVCPGLFLNNEYAKENVHENWNYHYAVVDPHDAQTGLGTPHCAELNAVWDAPPGSPRSYKTTNADTVPLMQDYWISFIRSFDPNTYRRPGAPTWEQWTVTGYEADQRGRRRLLVENGGVNGTVMETVDNGQWERCRVLSSWGVGLGQ